MSLSFLKQELYEVSVQANALGRIIPGKANAVDIGQETALGSTLGLGATETWKFHAMSELNLLTPFLSILIHTPSPVEDGTDTGFWNVGF